MKAALGLIPAPTSLMVVPGAGHDLKRGKFDLSEMTGRFLHLVAERGC